MARRQRARSGDRWEGRSPWPTVRLAFRGRPGLSAALVVAVGLGGLAPLGVILATARVVALAPEAVAAGVGSPEGRRLLLLLVLVAALFVLQQAIGSVLFNLAELLSRWLHGTTHRRLMLAAGAPTGIGHLQDAEVLDRVAVARGAGPFEMHAGHVIVGGADVARQWLHALGATVLVALIDPAAGVALLATALVLRRQVTTLLYHATLERTGQSNALRRATYFRELALAPVGAKELRVFGLQEWLAEAFDGTWRQAMESVWRARRGWLPLVAALGGMGLAVGASVFLVGRGALRGAVGLDEIAVFAQALFVIVNLIRITPSDYGLATGSHSVPALEALERDLAPGPRGRPADGLPRSGIRFEGVTFAYPGSPHPVLEGLDLEIPAGRSLAVVGANGAGKTTLIALLARLFDPDEGRITVDGTDLRELDPATWQRRIAAIFQDFVRFELPVTDNVAFDGVRSEALRRAATRAGALPVIEALPHGWDTVLSRQYPDGAELSGGQWQRVALARALYAVECGAGVLVLDEPTANLDVRAEAELYERFLDLTRGLTTILVAHRFSTVRQADRICVLEGGKVVESGDHAGLLVQDGRYARMFWAQAAAYAEAGDV